MYLYSILICMHIYVYIPIFVSRSKPISEKSLGMALRSTDYVRTCAISDASVPNASMAVGRRVAVS